MTPGAPNRTWLVRLGLALAVSALLIAIPVLMTVAQGTTEVSPDWLAEVRAGESLVLSDFRSRTIIEMHDGSLSFEQARRARTVVLGLALALVIGAAGALFGYAAWKWPDGMRGWLVGGCVLASVTAVGTVVGITHGTARILTLEQVKTGHVTLFGVARWTTEQRLTGGPAFRAIEECTPTDEGDFCLGWAVVEVPTEAGPVRLIQLPHSLGARPTYDDAQEATAQRMVDGLETFLQTR